MRTSNPTLNPQAFQGEYGSSLENSMSIQGVINKTLVLLGLVLLSASWTWNKLMSAISNSAGFESQASSSASIIMPAMMAGMIGSLIFGLITVFKKSWSPITAPIYALLQGLLLGGLSAFFEMQYPGLVVQAVFLTVGTLFCLLMAYKSGLIRATEKFKLGIVAATGAICLLYFVSIILGFFKVTVPFIYGSSPIGIGFSLFVVTIAALNLVLDFDFIEQASRMGAPRYMEWYAAYGLIVTLIWLYLEILRLLAKLRDRR